MVRGARRDSDEANSAPLRYLLIALLRFARNDEGDSRRKRDASRRSLSGQKSQNQAIVWDFPNNRMSSITEG